MIPARFKKAVSGSRNIASRGCRGCDAPTILCELVGKSLVGAKDSRFLGDIVYR